MTADLHLHSHFSDGTFSPEEIAERAAAQGLGALALTDHDSVEGCARMEAACLKLGIQFVPGAELTAEHGRQEVHVLAYWLDLSSQALVSRLAGFQAVRTNRIRDMVHKLNRHGIAITADAVFAIANCRSPGRPHVARALVAAGACKDYDDAFEKFLKKGRPGFAPKARMPAAEAIELIHHAGGLAVLAHPGLYHADHVIAEIASDGLDGLECWHTRHTAEGSEAYRRLADSLGLAATGGSDCHGMAKGQPLLGRVHLPEAEFRGLERRRHAQPAPAAPSN